MPWMEYHNLVTGLMFDTPLGRIMSIRAEDDPERLKLFDSEHHRIRSEWRNKCSKRVFDSYSEEEMRRATEELKNVFKKAFG